MARMQRISSHNGTIKPIGAWVNLNWMRESYTYFLPLSPASKSFFVYAHKDPPLLRWNNSRSTYSSSLVIHTQHVLTFQDYTFLTAIESAALISKLASCSNFNAGIPCIGWFQRHELICGLGATTARTGNGGRNHNRLRSVWTLYWNWASHHCT